MWPKLRCSCILILCSLTYIATGSELKTESRCFGESIVPLRCSAGSIIRVFNVTYGLSEGNICKHEEGDCVLTEQTSFGCNGKTSCDILIKEKTKYYSKLPSCQLHGNYLQVVYECVQVSDIHDLCSANRSGRMATSGYVSTPTLVSGHYNADHNCSYDIIGSSIRLHLITVNLTDSKDCLMIHNSLSSKTFCGGNGVVENLEIAHVPTTSVKLNFTTNQHGHSGAVWMYYEMIPLPLPPKRQTVPPTTTTRRQNIARRTTKSITTQVRVEEVNPFQSWTQRVESYDNIDGDTDITIYNNVSTHLPNSTIATILGLIFGLFGALIAGLFIIYFVKRYRDHKSKKARRRLGSSGNEHIMWHNITNECLSEIIHKHDVATEQAYSNNVMTKEINSNNPLTVPYCKQVEHSFC